MPVAGVILKKGRNMYEVPTVKAKLAAQGIAQPSQSRSECEAHYRASSQISGSVVNPATPGHSEVFR